MSQINVNQIAGLAQPLDSYGETWRYATAGFTVSFVPLTGGFPAIQTIAERQNIDPDATQAIYAVALATHGAGTTGTIVGTDGEASVQVTGGGTVTSVIGASGFADIQSGNVTKLIGVKGVCNASGGSTAEAAAAWLESATLTGGTVTTNYGLKIDDQTVGATNLAIKTGLGTVQFGDNQQQVTANGATVIRGQSSELLAIAAAASTDTSANLLPANSVIESVVVRVITIIPTAATFTVGDPTTAARFASGVAVAANTTAVGLTQTDQTGAAGPKQIAAAKVRITPNLTPGTATGVVRITAFWRQYVAPTS